MDTDNKSPLFAYTPTHSGDLQPANNTPCPESESKLQGNSIEEALEVTHLQNGDYPSTQASGPASKAYFGGAKCTKCLSVLDFIWNILTSHLGLFIILLLYTLAGAWMMLAIEGTEQKPFVAGVINRTGVVPDENFTQWFVGKTIRKRTDLWVDKDKEDKDSVIEDTYNGSLDLDSGNVTTEDITSIMTASQNSSVKLIVNATELQELLSSYFAERGVNARKDDIQDRTFWEWMLFCLTIYTTIGYGSVFPVTNSGRVATMIYATIGVPLFLITMAKMGKLLTRAVKLVWSYIRKCFYLKHVRRVRKNLALRRKSLTLKRGETNGHKNTTTNPRGSSSGSSGDAADVMEKPVGTGLDHLTMNGAAHETLETVDDAISYVSYKVDDEFNLNPLVAILITLVYILLGSLMYSQWEDEWGFYGSFYFIFISITTIGLGDIVPKHPIFFLMSSIYVLIGLSLVAMVIHVLVEFFTATIHIVENRIHIRRGHKEATIPTLLNDAQIQHIAEEIPEIRIIAMETEDEDNA